MIILSEKKSILSAKSDFIFKLIFGDQRNVDILEGLLMSILDIPHEEYDHLTIIDPHVKKEALAEKAGVLDVKLTTKSGLVLHIEIQILSDISDNPSYPNRYVIRAESENRGKMAA